MIKAIDLYNIMKHYTEEELKEIDIVIEPNRVYKCGLTAGYYVDKISEMTNQIRLIHMDETKKSSKLFEKGNELLNELNIKTKKVNSNEDIQNAENFSAILRSDNNGMS